jgi:hypothetical protein
MTTYQVTGQCAHVTTQGIDGSKRSELLYKGSIVPESATAAEIKHLLSLNLISAVGGEPLGTHEVGAVAGGEVRTGLDGNPVQSKEPGVGEPLTDNEQKSAAELEQKRAAARAKLPEDGSEPDGRAGQAVWVEYLLAKHPDRQYADLKDVDKSELQALAKQQA